MARRQPVALHKKIILVANTAWNLWNYRRSLIQALQAEGWSVVLVAPTDRFAVSLCTDTGATFLDWPQLSRRSFSPFQNAQALLHVLRLFQQEKPALAVFFTIKPNILGNLAARLAGVPALSVVEGLGYSGGSAFRWRWMAAPLLRLSLRHTRKVVFLNPDDRLEFIGKRLVKAAQTALIPGPGVDPAHFHPVPKADDKRLHFLFSGRFLVEKGVREFMEAAQQVQKEAPNAAFAVAGAPDPGNPGTITSAEVSAWQATSGVEFYGALDDIRPALAQTDVLVLPSYYREGVPRSVLEAMAMGKMIITTDSPGCRDTVDEGLNGYLVPPRDVPALVAALRRACQLTAEQRLAMGQHSFQKMQTTFSDQQVLPQFLALIHSAAQSPATPGTAGQSFQP
ncbi:MAG: glycosyltransferase family 4 protein [Saprospiraceae bacterium]|nr:glycosyltransferase family 4 protein [Saprospiraceae bacterium]